jgi:uncharacterized protein YcbX
MTDANTSADGSSPAMKVAQLYLYPIKSLRPTNLSEAQFTREGFLYDRSFMLRKDQGEGRPDGKRYRNMAVADFPEMALFSTDIKYPADDFDGEITVTHSPPEGEKKTITVPLQPNVRDLERMDINMHGSPTTGFNMGERYNSWFSSCFGYPVVFVYIGNNHRPVLFPEVTDQGPENQPSSWLSSITSTVSSFLSGQQNDGSNGEKINFHDCAPYLLVSQTSSDVVSSWLPEGEEMDISKFRPNLVLTGAATPWDEDYWGEVTIRSASSTDGDHAREITISLLHNCIRCVSLNVDFNTGKASKGKAGEVLKMLQKDRRVDKGKKYGAVFGRYGFLKAGSEGGVVKVGDEVVVSRRNEERTAFGGWLFDSERRWLGI